MNLPPEYEDSPFVKEPMSDEEVKVEELPEEIEPEAD